MCGNRHDHNLDRCDARRQDKAVVIAMDHDDRPDRAGRQAPGCLVDIGQLIVFVRELDTEGLGKAIAKIMAGGGLQGFAVMHHRFDGIGRNSTGKFLFVGLLSADDRNRQIVTVEGGISFEHAQGFFLGFLRCGMGRVPFLPVELGRAQERTGGLLPADNRHPLVVKLGQVTPGLDHIGIMVAKQGF